MVARSAYSSIDLAADDTDFQYDIAAFAESLGTFLEKGCHPWQIVEERLEEGGPKPS
jgi:hypothetical protein